MASSRFFILLASACLLVCSTREVFAQGTNHFTVNIPKKTTAPFIPIGEVKAVVALEVPIAVSGAVTFTFLDQSGTSHTIVCSPGCLPASVSFNDNENGSRGPDIITVASTSGPAGDPVRFEIDFLLQSNLATNSCTNTQQVDPNSYTVTINVNKIMGICLDSFDGRFRSIPLNSCTAQNFASQEIPIPLDDPNDKVATVNTLVPPTFACFTTRPPLDVVMVLDKSGSMSTPTTSGIGNTRMDALHSAVTTFLEDWAGLNPPNDKVGVVSFDTTAAVNTALQDVVANKAAIEGSVNAIAPGGSTSIGGGLMMANPSLAPDNVRRKVVLLMSDGQQNTDPLADASNGQVSTYCNQNSAPCGGGLTPTPEVPLPNQPQIYSVTLGPTVSAAINQDIANKSGGFYLNTEDVNKSLLSPFFLELLQNFVRFNSYETVRLISENVSPTTPYSAIVPLSTTSHDAVFSLLWPGQLGTLRLTVTPPGGALPIVRESASGFISLIQPLPLSAPFDPRGDWKILVEAPTPVGVLAAGRAPGDTIPFNLHLMTDDAGVKSELSVVPADYKAGDSIRLRAKLMNFGLPIVGLGPHPGDQVKVDLIKPGQSVGDMLSDSTASSQSSNPDIQSGAEAKLFNAVQNDPSALKHASDTIQLFDDGRPEHGDDVAGDGIYSALYAATLPGHYNFLFSVESTDPNSVRFSRQQLRTAYVRSVPDPGNTVIQSSILRHDNGGALSIVMTPRVKPGPGCAKSNPKCGRMGPGWANYFWFTAPSQTPFKAVDNLNGTYTATLNFTGSNPPRVSVHFENVLVVIGDSVPPDKLPDPLGPGNVLMPVPPPPPPRGTGRFALFLDAGGNFPHGTFGQAFDHGFSLNAGLEYILNQHFSVEGIFGYHHFPGKITPDLDLYQFSGNGKAYLTTGKFQPFVNGGIGGYRFTISGSSSTYFGGNVGAGVLYNLTSRFGVQGSYNFHVANTPVEATKFSTAQGGIRFVF